MERKTLFYVVWFAASALLFYVVCEAASSNHLERTAIIPNVKTMTAEDLHRDYRSDERADKRFRFLGSVLNVSGIVSGTHLSGGPGAALPQEPVVEMELKTGDYEMRINLAFYHDADEESVFALVPGRRITVQGRCTYAGGGYITLRECKFIKK